MSWIITLGLLLVGLAVIIKGGDLFVDAAGWMAERTGIPRVIIGATVVALATTMPEMIVSFIAAAGGQVDMAIGNAVGSVTVNTGLVMGLSLLCIPATVSRRSFWPRAALMLGAALVLVLAGLTGAVGVWAQIVLIVLFGLAMADNIRQARVGGRGAGKSPDRPRVPLAAASVEEDPCPPGPDGAAVAERAVPRGAADTVRHILQFAVGAVLIVIGSDLLVDNATVLARLMGVSERVIGVTIVAIGTSLPELVTTLTAITKGQSDLSVGNIIGANIIDLTLILPISALIAGRPLPVSAQAAMVDLPACLIIGCAALLPTAFTGKLRRWQGAMMVALYLEYLVVTILV